VSEYLAGIGVRAPRIEAFDPATGRALLEDLGDTHLADVWNEARRSGDPSGLARAGALYDQAVDLILRMQAPAASPFDPARTHNLEYDEAFIARYEPHSMRKSDRTPATRSPAPPASSCTGTSSRGTSWSPRAGSR
jgi:aminoglycoside/choline kinase family phosphotransferase